MNNEFIGMTDYVLESFYDLLTKGSEADSDSNSSGGRHHHSHECFMADTSEGKSKVSMMGEQLPRLALMARLREM
jgi:hypothetical protein